MSTTNFAGNLKQSLDRHMTPELVQEVCVCNQKWKEVKGLGTLSNLFGWEKAVKEIHKNVQDGNTAAATNGRNVGRISREHLISLINKFDEWHKLRKAIRIKVNKARTDFHARIVNESSGGSVSNVWSAIDKIAPRKLAGRHAMQKVEGGVVSGTGRDPQ